MPSTLLITLHALGASSIIIGSAIQYRNHLKTINYYQLFGSFLLLASGTMLFASNFNQATTQHLTAKLSIKLVLTVFICIISSKGIKRRSWKQGFYAVLLLTITNVLIAIKWEH